MTYKLAEKRGIKKGRFYSFYGGNHALFGNYCKIADAAGLTLELLVEKVEENGWQSLLEKLLKKIQCWLVLQSGARDPGIQVLYLSKSRRRRKLKWTS